MSLDGLLSFSYAPLRWLTVVGFVLCAVSFVGILIVLYRYLFTPYVPGYTSLAILVLFFGGAQFLTGGLVGEYVGRTAQQVEGAPAVRRRRADRLPGRTRPPALPQVTSPVPASPARLSIGQHAAVLGGFLLLLALFTYPLVRDPGHLLPYHKDPMMYGWTMVSNTRRLLSTPLAVFHGNTFYPHGNVVAHTDLLLTPTLFPAGPLYLLTGNPVLQYNLTLLLWWALSGWAMYVLAFTLLRSHVGAAIAGVVFSVCPFRTDFYLEFQMQLAFPIPLALLGWLRFLETRRPRYLVATLALVWVEALASMYYAIILGLCLATLTLLHLVARAPTWSWRLVRDVAIGLAALGLTLVPFIVPYAQNRSELGMERGLDQHDRNSADILTYFETGETKLYHFSPSGHTAETSLFMGFVALALAGLAFGLHDRPEPPTPPAGLRVTRRALAATTLGAATVLAVTLVMRALLRAAGVHFPPPWASSSLSWD